MIKLRLQPTISITRCKRTNPVQITSKMKRGIGYIPSPPHFGGSTFGSSENSYFFVRNRHAKQNIDFMNTKSLNTERAYWNVREITHHLR